MDLAVTIGTAPIKKERRIFSARRDRVLRDSVALRAQSRVSHFE
jgi:hypothetical protein